MANKIYSATPFGLDARIVEVEVDVSNGLPATIIVGLADTSIKESKERVRACLRGCKNFKYPLARITINLAPADQYKYGTQLDFAILLGILSASRQIDLDLKGSIFLGELSLDGRFRKIKSCLAMVLAAKAAGFERVFLPEDNYSEASLVSGISIIAVKGFENFLEIFNQKKFEPAASQLPNQTLESGKINFPRQAHTDFSEIQGHHFAKRALEIAASGGHNLLMSGSAGVGKSLLAEALGSIVPDPLPEQTLETIKIYSALGLVKDSLNLHPFRAPHHSVSLRAFVGGGALPKPGELSLAHNGVLFMDEFPEFPRAIIESLRQPLEQGFVEISRINGNYKFPAKFIFVAAQNPCPCGYYGDVTQNCSCTMGQIQRYKKKISGPILDRIDIQIYVKKVPLQNFSLNSQPAQNEKFESSEQVLKRVIATRDIQYQRAGKLNSMLNFNERKKYCSLGPNCLQLLNHAAEKFNFSTRTYTRVLKVARTIADIQNVQDVSEENLAEAIQYRIC